MHIFFFLLQPMAPEVMADPRRIQDVQMKRYLLSIQYASQTPLEIPEVQVKIPDAGGQIKLEDKAECTASGSGLVLAVVGKRARFNINTQTYKSKHLHVEICGPSGDRLRKKLVDIHGGVRGKGPVKQSSKDEPAEGTDIVSFSYQFIKVGHYQVNYMPRNIGIYEISITWGGEHINNSPYNIRAGLAKGAEQPPPYNKTKTVSFQDEKDPPGIPETVSEESGLPEHPGSLAARGRRQSLVRQSHVTRRGDSSESSGSGTLSTFSSINSSIAASLDKESGDIPTQAVSSMHNQFSRQSTMSSTRGSLLTRSSSVMYGAIDGPARVRTKRKILRRIIKGAGGKEELIQYPQEPKMKAIVKESSKLSTTGKSSPRRSASPNPPKQPTHPVNKEKIVTKYGDRMSKIILGRALYEVSKKIIMNNSHTKPTPNRTNADSKTEIPKKTVVSKENQNKTKTLEANKETSLNKPNAIQTSSTVTKPSSPVATLKQPDVQSGNKPLGELQQITQEFSPQISRDSDTSNSEREGPLGQEASEQSSIKHKGTKASFKPLSITPIVAPNTESEMSLLETVDRNGPDGQDEEPTLHTQKREQLVNKNKKNTLQNIDDIKENIAPAKSNGKDKSEHGKVKSKEVATTSKSKESQETNGVNDKPIILKVKRLPPNRPRADKETQCTAQGIKEETGWVSRRTVFQTKQKKDADNDSALGESRGSSMLASNTDSRDVDVGSWKSCEKDNKALKALEDFLDSKQVKQEIETFEMIPYRPRVPSDSAFVTRQRSRNLGRQTTFDSGYSDENSHILSSQRSSRDHSNWQSRSPSASSSHSILTSTPPPGLAVKSKIPSVPTIEQLKESSRSLEQRNKDAKVTDGSDATIAPPRLDVDFLSDPDAVTTSPNILPQNDGSLTVGSAVVVSSTNPTPGNSPLPTPSQLSTPAQSSKSTSPPMGEKVDMFSSMEKSTSPIAGMSVRDIGEKLVSGDMSLDVLLQGLEHDPEYSTREFLRKFRPVASRENTTESLHVMHDPLMDQSVLEPVDGKTSPRPGSSKSTNSLPLADRCRASGVGLYQGLVNTKNNFQVS